MVFSQRILSMIAPRTSHAESRSKKKRVAALQKVERWSVGALNTPIGQQVPPSRDRMSLALVPQGDGFRNTHGAKIQLDELAQESGPICVQPHRGGAAVFGSSVRRHIGRLWGTDVIGS